MARFEFSSKVIFETVPNNADILGVDSDGEYIYLLVRSIPSRFYAVLLYERDGTLFQTLSVSYTATYVRGFSKVDDSFYLSYFFNFVTHIHRLTESSGSLRLSNRSEIRAPSGFNFSNYSDFIYSIGRDTFTLVNSVNVGRDRIQISFVSYERELVLRNRRFDSVRSVRYEYNKPASFGSRTVTPIAFGVYGFSQYFISTAYGTTSPPLNSDNLLGFSENFTSTEVFNPVNFDLGESLKGYCFFGSQLVAVTDAKFYFFGAPDIVVPIDVRQQLFSFRDEYQAYNLTRGAGSNFSILQRDIKMISSAFDAAINLGGSRSIADQGRVVRFVPEYTIQGVRSGDNISYHGDSDPVDLPPTHWTIQSVLVSSKDHQVFLCTLGDL